MFEAENKDIDEEVIFTFYEDDDIRVRFQRSNIGPIIHCDIFEWSKSIKDKSLLIFEAICNEFKERGINEIFGLKEVEDKKCKKFISLFGFEEIGKVQVNGQEMQLWGLKTNEYSGE